MDILTHLTKCFKFKQEAKMHIHVKRYFYSNSELYINNDTETSANKLTIIEISLQHTELSKPK